MLQKTLVGITLLLLLICFGLADQNQGSNERLAPKLLNYQGYLTDTSGIPITNPSASMTFAIFDAVSAGNQKWTETQSSISVNKGVFSVLLGIVTPIPDSVFTASADRWLELTVGGQTLTPRTRITSVGYAYTSIYSDTATYARNITNDGDWIISGNDMYSNVSGNVGIGTTTPSMPLHVAASAKIDGNLYMNNTPINDISYLDIAQVQGYGIRLYSSDFYAINFGGYGEFSYGPVTAYSIKMNTADANGYGWVWGVDNQVPVAALGKNGDMQLAGNFYVIDSIGIGTTNPTQELDVTGNMRLTGALYDNLNETGTSGQVLSTTGSGVDWVEAAADTDWIIIGNNMYSGVSGNVGIGTSTPRYRLDVNGVVCGGINDTVNGVYGAVLSGYSNLAGDAASDTAATVCGGWNNSAIDKYTFVGGGGANISSGRYATIGGGYADTASGIYATVGGGLDNTSSNNYTVVGGGLSNIASGQQATVGGGSYNVASGIYTVVGGGYSNIASNNLGTIGGGYQNAAYGYSATIAGGILNSTNTMYGAILGGYSNQAGDSTLDTASAVCAGYNNSAMEKCAFVGGGRNNIASGIYATVGGGYQNAGSGYSATVGGGYLDTVEAVYGAILGGYNNQAGDSTLDTASAVCAGYNNTALEKYAFVGGGRWNTASGVYATVGGGFEDTANGSYATVGGGYRNAASGVRATVGGGFRNAASDTSATVGGGYADTASGYYATVGGGRYNVASGNYATVGGGYQNAGSGDYAIVGGGNDNIASGTYSFVASGYRNAAIGSAATVGGGSLDTAGGNYAVVGGGYRNNTASSTVGATVAGGSYNTVSGSYATVGGGYRDSCMAEYSFTVGNNSTVVSGYSNSAAFNGQSATASGQTRVGALSKVSGTFTIDHPLDPENKILNHYFVESPDMSNIYSGSVIIDAKGRAKVNLPDYFDALNRNPRVQLTGVGSSDVYVAEDFQGDQFSIGGKPGMKVYWTVIADRKDPSADITRILMPVEQPKTGGLVHRSLDDEFLVTTMGQLERMGKADGFKFRYASEKNRYEEMKRMIQQESTGR